MVLSLLAWCQAPAAEQDFWMLRPQGWESRTQGLSGDLVRQYIEPQRDAFVEVHSVKVGTITSAELADRWEAGARQKKLPYIGPRTESKKLNIDGQPAVIRVYRAGEGDGAMVTCVLYCVNKGKAYIAVGVWSAARGKELGRTVVKSITSLRFSDPSRASRPAPPKVSDGRTAPGPALSESRWVRGKGFSFWLRKPDSWSLDRKEEADSSMLVLRPPQAKAGLVVWAGQLKGDASAGQLAAVWESQSMPNLAKRTADCDAGQWPHLSGSAQLLCRGYAGVIKGTPTSTMALYLTKGRVGYVVMATFPQGDSETRQALRQIMRSFRLTPPDSGAKAPSPAGPPSISVEELAKVAPSASLEVMAKSPPMELVLESNLFYTGGINGMYPQVAALKAQQAQVAPDVFAAIHAMGERLDFLHNASRDYDRLGNEQYAYWCGLHAANPKYAFPFGLEKRLMKKRGAMQGTEEALWVVINQLRLELGRVAREAPQVPANENLVQCRLYVQLLGRSLDLIDFYKAKAEALLATTASTHGAFTNPRFGLPPEVTARVKRFLQPEMDRAALIIMRIYESWDQAFVAMQALDQMDGINRRMMAFSQGQLRSQYAQFAKQEADLRRAGKRDEAEVLKGVMESYRAMMDSPQARDLARGPAAQGPDNAQPTSLAESLARLLGPSVAHAGWKDRLKKYASSGYEGLKWLAKGTAKGIYHAAHDAANATLETYDHMTNVSARVFYGVEDRNVKQLAGDFVSTFKDMASRVGKGTLGQKTTEKARATFEWADSQVIGKGVLPQAFVNAITLGGYGLGKDYLTLNDANATAGEKAGATLGVTLNFIPIANLGGKLVTGLTKVGGKAAAGLIKAGAKLGGKMAAGLAKGAYQGSKSALNAAGRLALKSMKVIASSDAAKKAITKAQPMVRFQKFLVESGTPAGMLTGLYQGVLRANSKVIATQAALDTSKQALKTSIKRNLAATYKQMLKGFKEGFKGTLQEGLEEGAKLGVKAGSNAGKKSIYETAKAGAVYGWEAVSEPYKQTGKTLLKDLLYKTEGVGLALGFKNAVKNTSAFVYEETASQAAQDLLGKGVLHGVARGQNYELVEVGGDTRWSPAVVHQAAGMVQSTWKLADLGSAGARETKPVTRPVDFTISHSDTGDGFGSMTYKGQKLLLLNVKGRYPRERIKYKRFPGGLNLQVRDPSGKLIANQWGEVGDGYSGYSPGVGVHLTITPKQAQANPGPYHIKFIKKINLGSGKKPIWRYQTLLATSIQIKAELDQCCVGRRKAVVQAQQYVIICEDVTKLKPGTVRAGYGCESKLLMAGIPKVYGPKTRKECQQWVKAQIAHYECFVGAKEDPTGGPYGLRGQPCGGVLGKWKWFDGNSTTITADGRVNGDPNINWQCVGQNPQRITIKWDNNCKDDLTLDEVSSKLEGFGVSLGEKYPRKYPVWGTRVSSKKPWYKYRTICNMTEKQAQAALKQAGYKEVFGPADKQQCQQWIDRQKQLRR
ncbi:MAG: hypothetical protein KKE29_00725 [Proteobacteria bacterium]|nr:hypothetical protein [Pseudomonadota bacterium]MBU4576692.1 hypothetical protein [Pseudomonadota bacterium]MBU4597191.1 hypothetical protein [Pseudomonadota bacterium]